MMRSRGLRSVVPMPLMMALKMLMAASSAPRSEVVEEALDGEQELGHQLDDVAPDAVDAAAVVGQVGVDEPDAFRIDLGALRFDRLDELQAGPAGPAVPGPGLDGPLPVADQDP